MVGEEKEEGKKTKKDFLNQSSFIQLHSAFGRSIGILRAPVHALTLGARAARPPLDCSSEYDPKALAGTSIACADQRLGNPRANPRQAEGTGNK